MNTQIKHRLTGAVLYECDCDGASDAVRIRQAVVAAVKSGENLSGADLSGAYLSGASLSGAYLSGAYLSGADLSGASLSGAYLSGAYLSGADLSGASLSGASLSGASLNCAKAVIRVGPTRDGWEFFGVKHDACVMIKAGCRWFTAADARDHWTKTRAGTPRGAERLRFVDFIDAHFKDAVK